MQLSTTWASRAIRVQGSPALGFSAISAKATAYFCRIESPGEKSAKVPCNAKNAIRENSRAHAAPYF